VPDETSHRRHLAVRLDRAGMRQLLHLGQQNDIEAAGLYDARAGCVNVWCSPEDKPSCWNVAVEAGGLNFPRSYVGSLEWDWNEDDRAELFVEATPYDLLERKEQHMTMEEWETILDWLETKAHALLALAHHAPKVLGTQCPFCSYVLPYGELINTLLAHIASTHPHEKPSGLRIGGQVQLSTQNDTYPLPNAEQPSA
jgi:hypothetical protein